MRAFLLFYIFLFLMCDGFSAEDEDDNSETMFCPGSETKKIDPNAMCNGDADCPGATDETNCSCRTRIDPSRLCDNVYGCPTGEDELACPGCPGDKLKCSHSKENTRSLCIPSQKRCDSVKDCPNGMDEIECSLLSPNQNPLNISVPKFSSGFILQNIKNVWYPLCSGNDLNSEPLMKLVTSICQRTVGIADSGNIRITNPKVDRNAYNGKFALMTGFETKPFELVVRCPTLELIMVHCPLPKCGRKAPTLQVVSGVRNRFPDVRSPIRRMPGLRLPNNPVWPWIVQILRDGEPLCGATLLDSRWILTAGHCLNSFELYHFEVQLGSQTLLHSSFSPLEQIRTVSGVFIHPHYDPINLHNDIALLMVQKPFDYFNQWTSPACLPRPDFNVSFGTNCIVVDKYPQSEVLLEVEVPLVVCPTDRHPLSTICAGVNISSSHCQADSGRPMVCQDSADSGRWVVVGVGNNNGEGCKSPPGRPRVHTRVAHFINWIEQIMKKNTLPKVMPNQTCNGMTCRVGSTKCVHKNKICDAFADCPDAQDELDCPRSSPG